VLSVRSAPLVVAAQQTGAAKSLRHLVVGRGGITALLPAAALLPVLPSARTLLLARALLLPGALT
jgi:hypothetical protein